MDEQYSGARLAWMWDWVADPLVYFLLLTLDFMNSDGHRFNLPLDTFRAKAGVPCCP
jgi:hypothetical protein